MISNQGLYKISKVCAFSSLGYLIFASMPPTVLFGVYIGGVCLIVSLVYIWITKKRIRGERAILKKVNFSA